MTFVPPQQPSTPPGAPGDAGWHQSAQIPNQAAGYATAATEAPPETRPSTPEPIVGLDGRETYPDPKRSWKRSGGLLGGWALCWAAVLAFGIAWQAVGVPGETDPRDERPPTPYSTVNTFMEDTFKNEDFSKAAALQCEDYRGPEPADLAEEMGRDADGELPDASIGVPDEVEPGKWRTRVNFDDDEAGQQVLPYFVFIDSSTEWPCVTDVTPNS